MDTLPPFLERKPCALCGSDRHETEHAFPAERYPHDRFETASWDGRAEIPLRVVRCADCGLVFTNPSFREEHLGMVYPEDLVDDATSSADMDRLFQPHAKHVEMVESLRRHLGQDATLLDVGSRYGVLPWLAASRLGVRAYGIERNAASVRLGRRRFDKLFQGTLADLPELAEREGWPRIDAVVLDDVLEHLAHPRRDLEILTRVQPRGGLLVARQMEWKGVGHRLYGDRWYYLQPAAHMYYFDEVHLRALLGSVGYEVVEVVRAPPLENALRTLFLETPRRISRRVRRRKRAGKRMYLEQRKRAWNDMFAVVARRLGT